MLSQHLATFLARRDADPDRGTLPAFVRRELERYLGCGILARGFCRVHCESCGQDSLVAWSCRGRGFCPYCAGRRMVELYERFRDIERLTDGQRLQHEQLMARVARARAAPVWPISASIGVSSLISGGIGFLPTVLSVVETLDTQ